MADASFDSHCHLQDPRLAPDLPAVLGRARQAGISHLVCCGTREADWARVLELAQAHGQVLPSLGLHPWYVDAAQPGWLERLRGLVENRAIGIGECGLDFAPERPDRERQERAFSAQVLLARELDRPLSIHCVRAWDRLRAILKGTGIPAAGAVIHAFAGSLRDAAALQELGLHLSFGGAITRPGAKRAPLALAAVAGERLLLETDSPDLTPFGYDEPNEPARLVPITEAAARIRGMAPEALAALAHANARRLFRRLLP